MSRRAALFELNPEGVLSALFKLIFWSPISVKNIRVESVAWCADTSSDLISFVRIVGQ